MKLLFFLTLSVSLTLNACKHNDPVQPTTAELAGNWGGTYETQQAGSCAWSGPATVTATASWQVSGNTVTGTINRQYGQVSTPVSITGTISGNAVRLRETKANNVLCDGVGRIYFAQYAGSLTGNTLSLVGMDTLCPTQGCIFQRTLKLIRQ